MEIKDVLTHKISRINALKNEIRELEYFTKYISSRDCSWKYSGFILKIRQTVGVKIAGFFHFGCGTHEQEITIPKSMHGQVHKIAMSELAEKSKELSNLIK